MHLVGLLPDSTGGCCVRICAIGVRIVHIFLSLRIAARLCWHACELQHHMRSVHRVLGLVFSSLREYAAVVCY